MVCVSYVKATAVLLCPDLSHAFNNSSGEGRSLY